MTDEALDTGNTELTNEIKARTHHRDKIRASVIMGRLEKNALGELEPPMTNQQIKSAEILLKKTVPDLSSVTHKGDADNPIALIHKVERLIVDIANSDSTGIQTPPTAKPL